MAAQPATEAWPVLVTLPAEIDITTVDAVRDLITAAVAPGVTVVIADMTTTTFCDCAGASMLTRAHIEAAGCGTELRLLKPPPAPSCASWNWRALTTCWRSTRAWRTPSCPEPANPRRSVGGPRARHPARSTAAKSALTVAHPLA